MIQIKNTDVYGFEAAIRGVRKNSLNESDSIRDQNLFYLGENDMKLLKILTEIGTDVGKFLHFITVSMDVTAPLYWWKNFFDTYKVGTVTNSCTTMQKNHTKEFTLDDFSHEHLGGQPLEALKFTVLCLNNARECFLQNMRKEDWWQMIQLLPSSYNQTRTILLNYAVLKNMYYARKDYSMDEWRDFCHWIEDLPYAEELICGGVEE